MSAKEYGKDGQRLRCAGSRMGAKYASATKRAGQSTSAGNNFSGKSRAGFAFIVICAWA